MRAKRIDEFKRGQDVKKSLDVGWTSSANTDARLQRLRDLGFEFADVDAAKLTPEDLGKYEEYTKELMGIGASPEDMYLDFDNPPSISLACWVVRDNNTVLTRHVKKEDAELVKEVLEALPFHRKPPNIEVIKKSRDSINAMTVNLDYDTQHYALMGLSERREELMEKISSMRYDEG